MATSPLSDYPGPTTTLPQSRLRSTTSSPDPNPNPKPIRPIPGDYGHPFFGPIKDRLDYFYNQGEAEFFRSRAKKYDSTVFRANMPPGPPIARDSRVIVLLDAKSFPVIFDLSKVDKTEVLLGPFAPSVSFTGGHRVFPYLDPSEPNHNKLKSLIFFLLKSTHDRIIPEFHSTFSDFFDKLESEVATKKKAEFNSPVGEAAFNFLARAWYGVDPTRTHIPDGSKFNQHWAFLMLAPTLTVGLPRFLEEITIHAFRLPGCLIKRDYNKLYKFFYDNSSPILDEASRIGLSKEEACHNLLFATCFNSLGGINILFSSIINEIGAAGERLQAELAKEIRSAVKSANGKVTMAAMERMPLVKSAVYEVLRIHPPVPAQYGRAKKDFVVESHDSAFEVKEGELLLGYQPFATNDPVIFDRPEEFMANRFVGEEGERLLRYVLWSNGPETERSTVSNKQCPGKDFVPLVSRLLMVELFLRYDSFEIEAGKGLLGPDPKITKLVKATS